MFAASALVSVRAGGSERVGRKLVRERERESAEKQMFFCERDRDRHTHTHTDLKGK